MAQKTYRMAIIGIGGIATMHAKAIADIENATLVAGSCRGEEKGRKFASEFGCQWYSDYVKMLDAEKPDVVAICTPSGLHLEPTQACAQRGIHVICEKPLEITTARVDEMIEVTRKAGVLLGGIFPQRYNPVVRTVRDALAAGRFGSLAVANSYVPWWRDDAYYAPERWQGTLAMDGGGAMMNQSIHGVDAIQWLVSATMPDLKPEENPVQEIFAFTGKRGHDPSLIEVEDTAVAVMRFRDGSLGQLLGATSMYPGSLKRIQIAGRDGTAEIMEDQLVTFQFRNQDPQDEQIRQQYAGENQSKGGAADPLAIGHTGHTRNIQAFLDALDAGCSPDIDGVQGRKAVAIIEALYESAGTGRLVTIK